MEKSSLMKSVLMKFNVSTSVLSNENSQTQCHICTKIFSVLHQRKICSVCSLSVCKEHSGGEVPDENRVCDYCKYQRLNEDICEQMKPIIENKYQQLQEEVDKQEAVRSQNDQISKKIALVDNELQSMFKVLETGTIKLERELESVTQINESLLSQVEDLRNILRYQTENERAQAEALEYNKQELITGRERIYQLIEEIKNNENKDDELIRNLLQLLNIKELEDYLCRECYMLMKAFVEHISCSYINQYKKSRCSLERCSNCLIL